MTHLHLIALVVREYDPAIRFFVDVLGFDLVEDVPSTTTDGRPKRWVVVRPRGAETGILLARADGSEQDAVVGHQFAGRVGLFLRVDDFDASYQRMIAAGVEFVRPPRDEPYGKVAVFVDIAGNRWDLLGPPIVDEKTHSSATIRSARPEDRNDWVRLRHALWPDTTLDQHERDVERFLAGRRHEPAEALIAFDDDGHAVGFVELSIRTIVDSCATDRVGYLEGWFVVPEARRRGIGAALVAAAEHWAKGCGCREFASDAALDNEASQRAHLALGFSETGRGVNFRKDL